MALHLSPTDVLLMPKLFLFTDIDAPNSTNTVPGAVDEDASKQLPWTLPDDLLVKTISPP